VTSTDPHQGRATSFGTAAEAYNTFRPPPPAALADLLGPLDGVESVDLAAGTGLLTRFLADRGASVTAVEPDDRMADVIRRTARGVTVLVGSAEAIPLPEASVDLVTVSSAWHWFDHQRAPVEIARILRPGGRLVVLWNGVDYRSGWSTELARLRNEVAGAAPSSRPRREVVLADDLPFGPVVTDVIDWEWSRTADQLVGLLGTYSGALVSRPEARQRLADGVRAVVDAHAVDGLVTLTMACRCITATRL